MTILTTHELQEQLLDLPKWQIAEGKLTREFVFADFTEALSFINRVGTLAEELQHHPEIFNNYNTVTLSLMTHDADGITEKDIDLAKRIDLL